MPIDSTSIELPAMSEADSRRLDIDSKQQVIGQLLHDCGCEGVLVLNPANVRWLSSGAGPVGLFGRDELPGLYFSSHQRWLLASSTDSQRFFAEELDGLGFMLKEWHWSSSREQMLADLVYGRSVACDQVFRDCKPTGAFFVAERRRLTPYELERMTELGRTVAHAVEATARNFDWGDSEQEIAGHLAHRLLRHGVEPLGLQVTGDDRRREFRRRGFGADTVGHICTLQATGRRFGLHATACRTVSRSPLDDAQRAEFDAAFRLRAGHLVNGRISERVVGTLEAGRALMRPTEYEHDWFAAPPVMLTGREPSEGTFPIAAQDRWTAGWAAVWQERLGETAIVDTYVLNPDGWRLITPTNDWPVRRAVLPGQAFDFADVLVREV